MRRCQKVGTDSDEVVYGSKAIVVTASAFPTTSATVAFVYGY